MLRTKMDASNKTAITSQNVLSSSETENRGNFRQYILVFFATMFGIIALDWAYTYSCPMLYQESGYVVWRAKFTALYDCQVSTDVMLGDSRAQAAFIPKRFSPDAYNLSFGGSTPLDTYLVFKKLSRCLTPGQRVMISISPGEFTHLQPWLWENGARYGFFSFSDLREIAAGATSVDDASVETMHTRFGSGIGRDILYGSHFPALYTNNLVSSRVMLRGAINRELLNSAEGRRGFLPFGFRGGATEPISEVHDKHFRPLPVIDLFFRRTIDLARRANVKIDFVAAPLSQRSADAFQPTYEADFSAYVDGVAAAYPGVFRVVTPLFFAFADDLFSDDAHVSEKGAAHFTDWLAECLQRSPCKTPGLH